MASTPGPSVGVADGHRQHWAEHGRRLHAGLKDGDDVAMGLGVLDQLQNNGDKEHQVDDGVL